MKEKTKSILDELTIRVPELDICKDELMAAYGILYQCFSTGGKLLICGNGGSSADSEHIVGELMKGFMLKRKISEQFTEKLTALYKEDGADIASALQGALPAVSLTSQTAFTSAFINDADPAMVYAQQVYGLGRAGDALLGISTTGNSANVANAVKVAKALGIKTIGLTGGDGGKLAALSDVAIAVPAKETYRVQEYHLPVYHAICAMLENEFFG